MQIVNTTPKVLKHQIEEAIAKAVAEYRKDYPYDTLEFPQSVIVEEQ